MYDSESLPAEGLVIVLIKIEDDDRREQLIHRIINLPSDEITESLFEIHTGDWDEGLWEEELEWFWQLLFGDDTLTVWHFTGGEYFRYVLTADD